MVLCPFIITVCDETCVWMIALSLPLLGILPSFPLSYLSKLPVWRRWRRWRRGGRGGSRARGHAPLCRSPVAWQMLCLNLRGWATLRRTEADDGQTEGRTATFSPQSSPPLAPPPTRTWTPAAFSFVAPIALKNMSELPILSFQSLPS